jgi:hypothetical protein
VATVIGGVSVTKNSYTTRLALGIGLLGAAMSAQAAMVTYDFTVIANVSGFTSGTGNSATYTAGGVSVTATAFGLTGTGGTTFQQGELVQSLSGDQNLRGLGVCNVLEGTEATTCGDPNHKVDNVGQLDFILFQFSAPVTFKNMLLTLALNVNNSPPPSDLDVTYWVGTLPSNTVLSGTLPVAGLGSRNDDDTPLIAFPNTGRTLTFLPGLTGNSLLVAARLPGNGADTTTDAFKIQALTIDAVPEPATMGLVGAALVGLAFWKRKRNL